MQDTNDDPRPDLNQVIETVGDLVKGTQEVDFAKATPCSEFNVGNLLDHMISVLNRVGALGNGAPFSSVEEEVFTERASAWGDFAKTAEQAWSDDSKLGETFEVPWGSFPGAALLVFYTAEYAVHGWDLAQATGRKLELPDEILSSALLTIKMIPAEGREAEEVPFDVPTDSGENVSTLEKVVAWTGREV